MSKQNQKCLNTGERMFLCLQYRSRWMCCFFLGDLPRRVMANSNLANMGYPRSDVSIAVRATSGYEDAVVELFFDPRSKLTNSRTTTTTTTVI